jgi:hypothetical protein
MKKTILILSVFVALNAQAQSNIGINTANPDASAILDITHTTRGLLIPRIVLTATNVAAPIVTPATSLLVYNTNTTVGVNGVTPGYYYWDGLQWASLSTPPPTTNTLTNVTNTITSTVDGVIATSPVVNTVSNALTGSNLTTTVNGVAGAPVDLSTLVPATSTTNTLSTVGNTITSTVNSVVATAPAVNTVTNTSTGNNLTTTVNGVAGTAVPIVNTISNTLTGTNLTTTVNGITGAVVNLSSIVPATTVSNTSIANNLTTTVNGITSTAVSMVNTISNTSTANNLTTTVNGVAGTAVPMVNSLSNTYNTTTGVFNTTVNGIAGANVTLPTPQSIKDSVTNNAWLLKGNAGTTAGTNFVGTTDAKDLVFKTNSIENMRILNTNGNVGVGTATPARLFTNINTTDSYSNVSSEAVGQNAKSLSWYSDLNGFTTSIINTGASASANGLHVRTLGTSATHKILTLGTGISSVPNANIDVMTVLGNGNVGIGTTTPNAKLYLRDNIPVGSLDLVMDNVAPSGQQWVFESIATFGTFTPGSFAIGNRTTSSNPVVITPANNVGLGTVAPTSKLHVYNGDIQVTNPSGLQEAYIDQNGGIELFRAPTSTIAPEISGYIDFKKVKTNDIDFRINYDNTLGTNGGLMFMSTLTGFSPAISRMVILNQNGNVGIGTNAPTEKLEVQGSVKIVDGTQGLGRVLTSDATGKATWKEAAVNTNKFGHALPYPASVAVSATGGLITLGAPFTITTTGIYRVLVDATIPQGMILGIDNASVGNAVLYATVTNRYYSQYFVYIGAGTHNLILYNDNNGALTNGGPYWNFYIEGPIN